MPEGQVAFLQVMSCSSLLMLMHASPACLASFRALKRHDKFHMRFWLHMRIVCGDLGVPGVWRQSWTDLMHVIVLYGQFEGV